MREQTVHFMQGMVDSGIDRREVLYLLRRDLEQEMDELLAGLRKDETMWISDEALHQRKQLNRIQENIRQATDCGGFLYSLREFYSTYEGTQQLMLETMEAVTSPGGPGMDHLHIVPPSLARVTRLHMQRRIRYQLYRLLILGHPDVSDQRELPPMDSLEELLSYSRDILQPQLDSLGNALDGRWAYEKRRVTLFRRFQVEQYVAVHPAPEEIRQLPGGWDIRPGEHGDKRIAGRGYMTNLTPEQVMRRWGKLKVNHLQVDLFSQLANPDADPQDVLKGCFPRGYLVDPQEYFRRWNEYQIAWTVYERRQRGQSVYGS